MMPTMEVRDATPDDWPAWRRMWVANCAHYGVSMPEAADRELWRRIMDPAHPVAALVCGAPDSGGELAGLAHYVLHPHTFSDRMVCYLEDLWVDPGARRAGIARRLIEALVARGREQSWRRIYWHTEADNAAARALYDRIARLTDYVRYDITLA
jgi:ribosomal protein S18 acetylase RimI-like enzyme